MRCDAARLTLSARLDDASDPAVDAELDAHLATCAGCRRFRDSVLRVRDGARLESAVSVPDLVEPIMERVRSHRRRSRVNPRTILVTAASLAAISLIVVAVTVNAPPPGGARAEAIRVIRTRTLLVWTPGEVTRQVADAVANVDGVASIARVRSGVVWLDEWTSSDHRTYRPPRGMRIPFELAAIDPASYAPFAPSPESTVLDGLPHGEIVLSARGAALRTISPTGTSSGTSVTVSGERLTVVGRVDDGVIGAHEGVVSRRTGDALGVTRVRYLLVALADGASVDVVSGLIRGAITDDTPVRVRALGETPYLRHGDAVLPQARVKELFGEFAAVETSGGNLRVDPSWTKRNIVNAKVPVLGTVRCHRRVIPQLRAAMEEIVRDGLADQIRPDDFGGCFVPRYLSQDHDAGLSHHAWGIAFDVNVGSNAFGKPPQLHPRVVEIMEHWGFTWGGRWLVPDGMHFEFVRFPPETLG